jgi:hypothetical protein
MKMERNWKREDKKRREGREGVECIPPTRVQPPHPFFFKLCRVYSCAARTIRFAAHGWDVKAVRLVPLLRTPTGTSPSCHPSNNRHCHVLARGATRCRAVTVHAANAKVGAQRICNKSYAAHNSVLKLTHYHIHRGACGASTSIDLHYLTAPKRRRTLTLLGMRRPAGGVDRPSGNFSIFLPPPPRSARLITAK